MPHHISDVDTWGGPDRNYFVFVALSVVLGFFGADHFYLRSFGTGTQKLLMNVFGLGFWYLWDIIQIWKDGDKIRKDGLNGPFDWLQGIGRGVFHPLPAEVQTGGGDGESVGQDGGPGVASAAPKSYLTYAFLAIFFGWLGADKFYLGQFWQGLAKVLSCFNIFLFLFGWLWVVWDSVYAFFLTDKIMKEGISPPLPFSYVFDTIDPSVFKVGTAAAPTTSLFDSIYGFNSAFPTLNFSKVYKDIMAPLMVPPIAKGLQMVINPASAMPSLPSMPSLPTQSSLPSLPTMPKIPTANSLVATAASSLAAASNDEVVRPMTGGGGVMPAGGPGPVIAGTLTAIVLAGGLKGFYDIISKQYG